ncbi:MAG: Zn-dependent protease [bacterium TMED198]|nr:MAG: Zn-dependent protease [bacterium TMED198]
MKNYFESLGSRMMNEIKANEHLFVSVNGEKSHFVRFNNAKVRQLGTVEDLNLSIKLISGNKVSDGSMTCSGDLEDDTIRGLDELTRIRKEIDSLPEDPFVIFPKAGDGSSNEYSGSLLEPSETVEALVPAMKGNDLSGIWASGKVFCGNLNSKGLSHWFSTDTFSLDYSLVTSAKKMVKATFADTTWNQEAYEKYMNGSIDKLRLMEIDSITIDPGSYRTYIAPAGVSDIIDMFSWGGVSEASIQQGDSALCKMRSSSAKLSNCFSLKEDFSRGTVPQFNSDGEVAPESLPLISRGSLENTLVSSRTAKEYSVKSNFAGRGEGMRAPFMDPGGLSEEDILKRLDRGVYLSNLHYLNWSDRIGGRITGMTRYSCFWVENGEIVAPINDMRFDDSIYNFFGENMEDATNKSQFNPDIGTYDGRGFGGTFCPGVLLRSFELTL